MPTGDTSAAPGRGAGKGQPLGSGVDIEDYVSLGVLAAIWGASFLFIKVAVRELSPVAMVFGRSLFGAAIVYGALRFSRMPLALFRGHLRAGLVIALFNAAIPYSLFAFGESFIDSSLAGILNATLPLWVALMSPLWREAESLRRTQAAGLGLGFLGAVILARPHGGLLSGSVLGVAACLVATLSYAFATHFSKRAFRDVPPHVPALAQCVGAALVLAPFAILTRPTHLPSPAALGAVAALGLGGTGMAMLISYRLIKRVGASRTSVVTYLLPPSALFWGVVLLHERPAATSFVALGLILGGVFLITRPSGRSRRVAEEPVEATLRA